MSGRFPVLQSSLVSLLVLAPLAALAASSPTLRLGDLFDTRPGEGPFVAGEVHYDASGPVLFKPDTASWRAPRPTPTPAPPDIDIPEGVNLPRLKPLATNDSFMEEDVGRPAFRSRGRTLDRKLPPDKALLEIETPYRQVRVEYQLLPVQEPGAPELEELRFFHGPETKEVFAVPSGRYRLKRFFWVENDPSSIATETYEAQLLTARRLYQFNPAEDEEARILQEYFQ